MKYNLQRTYNMPENAEALANFTFTYVDLNNIIVLQNINILQKFINVSIGFASSFLVKNSPSIYKKIILAFKYIF